MMETLLHSPKSIVPPKTNGTVTTTATTTTTTNTAVTTTTATTESLLQDVLRKVESSVLELISQQTTVPNNMNDKDNQSHIGMDYLHVKNTIFISYMIDLILHLRQYYLSTSSSKKSNNTKKEEEDDDDVVDNTDESNVEDDSNDEHDDDNDSDEEEEDSNDNDDGDDDDDDGTDNKNNQDRDTSPLKDNDNDDVNSNNRKKNRNIQRLIEMKVLLDKISTGLDRKLRYQIDKLLLLLVNGNNNNTTSSSSNVERIRSHIGNNRRNDNDPLQFRPSLLHNNGDAMNDDDRDSDDNSDDEDDDDDEGLKMNDVDDVDEDYKAAKQTIDAVRGSTLSLSKKSKKRSISEADDETVQGGDGIYRAPRFMSTPYPNGSTNNSRTGVGDDIMNSFDPNDNNDIDIINDRNSKQMKQIQRQEDRDQQRIRNSEVTMLLREEYGQYKNIPEQDDITGSGTGGGIVSKMNNRTNSNTTVNVQTNKILRQIQEKDKFEEEYMIRLPRTKQERKQQVLMKQQRTGQNQNISQQITNDLNHIINSTSRHRNKQKKYK